MHFMLEISCLETFTIDTNRVCPSYSTIPFPNVSGTTALIDATQLPPPLDMWGTYAQHDTTPFNSHDKRYSQP
ncbi:hypothetical protein RDI58_003918 [Solanum bulbocastanum]|uniref:Uncharacterized protein n=1 Tax=Solanum bulbocastanum TaxID=147425 RepID=A0AAN8U5I0_SOLBU